MKIVVADRGSLAYGTWHVVRVLGFDWSDSVEGTRAADGFDQPSGDEAQLGGSVGTTHQAWRATTTVTGRSLLTAALMEADF